MKEDEKILVYLHGEDSNCGENHEVIAKIAKTLDVKLITFNGLNKIGDNKHRWYGSLPMSGVSDSAYYVLKEVEKHLIHKKWENVILMGRGQGATMALLTAQGTQKVIKNVIMIAPTNPDFALQFWVQNPNLKIVWIETGKSSELESKKLQNSFERFIHGGRHVHHHRDEKSTFEILSTDLPDILKQIV